MTMLKAHVLQHVPFEGLGSIAPWLETNNARIRYTRFFETPLLPSLNSTDMIIAMGGPMSANDEAELPWLVPEKAFIRDAVLRGIPVLGVCLGAQLIAAAMGAKVYPNAVKEIGWLPVRAVPAPPGTFRFPEELIAFHWHGETFDLPTEAVRIAGSAGCANQAFQLGPKAIGLQFHLETTPESASALLQNSLDDLTPGPYIQTESEMREAPLSSYQAINAVMNEILSYLVRV
jgi:GMP synthase-like glutamine amidotransferase